MRNLTALVATIALLPALLMAPFTHVHVGTVAAHEAAMVHSHFSAHVHPQTPPSPAATIDDNDDDRHLALQLDLFQFSTLQAFSIPDLPAAGFVEPEIYVISEYRLQTLECSHDPPLLRTSGFRAPPV